MAQDFLGKLQAGYDAFGSGDERKFIELLHPEFRYRARAELPGGGEYVGRDAFDRRLAELREMFDGLRFEPREYIVHAEHVVVPLRWSGRGGTSGVEVSQDVFHVWRIRDGMGLELQVFSDREEALRCAGIEDAGP